MPGHQTWLPVGAALSCLCVNRFLISVLLNLLEERIWELPVSHASAVLREEGRPLPVECKKTQGIVG